MRGKKRLERISMDPTRTQSETITSPIGTRMSIGNPFGAVTALMQTNSRVV